MPIKHAYSVPEPFPTRVFTSVKSHTAISTEIQKYVGESLLHFLGVWFLPLKSKWIGLANFLVYVKFEPASVLILVKGSYWQFKQEERTSTLPREPAAFPFLLRVHLPSVPPCGHLSVGSSKSTGWGHPVLSRGQHAVAKVTSFLWPFLIAPRPKASLTPKGNSMEQNWFWIPFIGHLGSLLDMAIYDLPSQHEMQPDSREAIYFLVRHYAAT